MPYFFLPISFVTSACYGLVAWQLFRQPHLKAPSVGVSMLMLVALLMHTGLVGISVFGRGAIHLGFGNAVSMILWLSVLVYGLASLRYLLPGVQAWVTAFAAFGVLMPLVFPDVRPVPFSNLPGFKAHLIVSLLAFSLLFIAALQAVFMIAFEKRLHSGAAAAGMADMPPLLTLEAVLFRLIWTGYVLLTLALISGVFFSEQIFGKAIPLTHKTIFAVMSWIVFGVLLAGRRIRGWRGKLALRWTISGFVLLVLGYVVSKFVLEILLHRIPA
jgi:ABC-type uncharacterized transport system permease subunit